MLFALDNDLFARFDDVALFVGMSEGTADTLGGHVLHRPETTIAMLVIQQRTQEFIAIKIWPEHVGEIEFRIGDLPEEEVRDAHLARCADEQVGVGYIAV